MNPVKELIALAYEINNPKLYMRVIIELSEYRQHILSTGAKWWAAWEEVKAIKNANFLYGEIEKLQKMILE